MSVQFEWDTNKARANLARHHVTFEEAVSVFADPLACIFDDDTHSSSEHREIMIGHSGQNRLLLVCFTERANAIRIFSARETTRKERRDYEENASFRVS